MTSRRKKFMSKKEKKEKCSCGETSDMEKMKSFLSPNAYNILVAAISDKGREDSEEVDQKELINGLGEIIEVLKKIVNDMAEDGKEEPKDDSGCDGDCSNCEFGIHINISNKSDDNKDDDKATELAGHLRKVIGKMIEDYGVRTFGDAMLVIRDAPDGDRFPPLTEIVDIVDQDRQVKKFKKFIKKTVRKMLYKEYDNSELMRNEDEFNDHVNDLITSHIEYHNERFHPKATKKEKE
jgi:hypothetical protein